MSQKELKSKAREILDRIGECKDLQRSHPEEYQFFTDVLFPRHPSYPDKFMGVKRVGIRKNTSFKTLEVYLHYNNDTSDGVSVMKTCITGVKKDGLTITMRTSIYDQIQDFRSTANQICEICDSTDNLEVDHVEPQFTELKQNFIQKHSIVPYKFDNNADNTKKFREEDKEFEDLWKSYHKKKAQLRMLCAKCNNSRDKIIYRKIPRNITKEFENVIKTRFKTCIISHCINDILSVCLINDKSEYYTKNEHYKDNGIVLRYDLAQSFQNYDFTINPDTMKIVLTNNLSEYHMKLLTANKKLNISFNGGEIANLRIHYKKFRDQF